MVADKIVLGTDTFVAIAKQLHQSGKITLDQYGEMLRRSKTIKPELRHNIIHHGNNTLEEKGR